MPVTLLAPIVAITTCLRRTQTVYIVIDRSRAPKDVQSHRGRIFGPVKIGAYPVVYVASLFPGWVLNNPVMDEDWSPYLQTLEEHSAWWLVTEGRLLLYPQGYCVLSNELK